MEKSFSLPEPGKVYRHFKGNFYLVEDIAYSSETDEALVIYRPLYANPSRPLYARPASMFFEEVKKDRKDNITGQTYRFEQHGYPEFLS